MDEMGFSQATSDFPALSSLFRSIEIPFKLYSKALLMVIAFIYFITASFEFFMFISSYREMRMLYQECHTPTPFARHVNKINPLDK